MITRRGAKQAIEGDRLRLLGVVHLRCMSFLRVAQVGDGVGHLVAVGSVEVVCCAPAVGALEEGGLVNSGAIVFRRRGSVGGCRRSVCRALGRDVGARRARRGVCVNRGDICFHRWNIGAGRRSRWDVCIDRWDIGVSRRHVCVRRRARRDIRLRVRRSRIVTLFIDTCCQ